MMMSREGGNTRKRRRAGHRKQVEKVFPNCSNRKTSSPVDFDGGGGRLDEGVLTKILALLPVESVIRFKSVSKSWLSLISSDYFRTLRKPPPPPSLIITTREPDFVLKRIEFFYSDQITKGIETPRVTPFHIDGIDTDNSSLQIVSCSNGLMLLKKMNRYVYYVYNPTTKHSQELMLEHCVFGLHLVFDPSISPHYKIVCFSLFREGGLLQNLVVFESKTAKWSVCGEFFESGGMLDVVQYKSFFYFIYTATDCLHCFDFVKRDSQFVVCRMPKRAGTDRVSCKLGESNGTLYFCALLIHDAQNTTGAALWELQVNGDDPRQCKWLLKYHHRVHHLEDQDRRGLSLLKIIPESSTILINICGKIVSYRFLDKTYKELLDVGSRPYSVHAHHFGETLALP